MLKINCICIHDQPATVQYRGIVQLCEGDILWLICVCKTVRKCVCLYRCVCVCVRRDIDFPVPWERKGWKKSNPFFIPLRVFIYSDANIKLNTVNREIVDIESVCPLSCSAIFGMLTETANLTYYIRWGIHAFHWFCESHRAEHWAKRWAITNFLVLNNFQIHLMNTHTDKPVVTFTLC